MGGFRKVELPRGQIVLWSQSLEDAVAGDHPVRLFEQMLGGAAFGEVFREWRREYVLLEGRPPYDPRDLAGLYLYGMLHRLRSSRQLEGACHNRLDVIWLMQSQKPDHATIAGFVARHGKLLKKLFRQTIRVALKAGLVKLAHVSVDGTKLEADAGRGSVRSREWLEAAKAKRAAEAEAAEAAEAAAAELEKEWAANEVKESKLFSEQSPPADAQAGPPGSAARRAAFQKKQAKLAEALAAIERRSQEADADGGTPPKAIASTTDPDARVMPDKQAKSKPGYNAQIAVDAEAGVILACDVNDRPEDVGQLTPMLKQVQEQTGSLPHECSADSGYASGSELAELERMNVSGYLPDAGQNSGIAKPDDKQAEALAAARLGQALTPEQWSALPRDNRKMLDKSAFTYDLPNKAYRCPAGVSLTVLRHSADRKTWGVAHRTQYGGNPACASCQYAKQCCANPAKGRTINRDQYEDHRDRMRQKMASDQGRARYKLRRQTVEPRFGMLKAALGVRRFMHRSLDKVGVEFSLLCTAMNIKVLLREWAKTGPALSP
ncbi:MAG TPA: IS1182 family transposase [Rhodopila sp.]